MFGIDQTTFQVLSHVFLIINQKKNIPVIIKLVSKMKKKLLLLSLISSFFISAQEKRTISNGLAFFEASVPLFEPIKAQNTDVICVLNTKKGTILFEIYVDQFAFERSLMKEHFNENYLESKKYPKAIFKGLIEKFDLKDTVSYSKKYYIRGKINIHGKSKNIRVSAHLKKVVEGIEITSNFNLNSDDYNIEIPYIVRSKISKNVKVKIKVIL